MRQKVLRLVFLESIQEDKLLQWPDEIELGLDLQSRRLEAHKQKLNMLQSILHIRLFCVALTGNNSNEILVVHCYWHFNIFDVLALCICK